MLISRFLSRLLAVLLVSLAGCTSQPSGSLHLLVSGQQALSASDVSRVRVTVSEASMAPLSLDLAKASGTWGGTLGTLPAGPDRTVLAEAFDASGTLRFRGQAEPVTITANEPTVVALTLQDLAPAMAYGNEAPFIDSVVASPSTVQPGGTLSLVAAAHDANAGDTLTWAWTAAAGTFSALTAASTSWRAPASTGVQTLTVTVTDSRGLKAAFSVAVNVVSNLSGGSAALELAFNAWPSVSKVSASRNPVDAGQSTTVSVTATDADADALSYQWTASCPGTWTNSTASTATFVPSAIPPGACNNCPLTVTVQDGRGGQSTGHVNLCVAAAAVARFPPAFTQASQSATSATAGQAVTFNVTAADPQGASMTFAWSADMGSVGAAQNTATTSRWAWTAPSLPASTTATITVTATNAYGRTVTKRFTVQCLQQSYCGDGVTNGSEACDYGNNSQCPYGQSCYQCNTSCTGYQYVSGGYCGDSATNGPEACDYGNNSCPYGQSCYQCNTSCNGYQWGPPSYCGDGVTNGPEACDYGNNSPCPYGQSCVQCNTSCNGYQWGPGGSCGDGVTNGPEVCDYASNSPCPYGQSCLQCYTSCNGYYYGWGGDCGDGVVNGPEVCDYGNNSQCNSTCTGTVVDPGVCSSSNPVESLFIGWYLGDLNRCADAGGLSWWVGQYYSYSGCGPYTNVYDSVRNACFHAAFLDGARAAGEYP